jgi:predicted RNA-binding protein
MCQMNVMLDSGDQPELVMENASLLEVTDGGIQVSSLFDPPKLIGGVRVVKIDFMDGKVLLEKTGE